MSKLASFLVPGIEALPRPPTGVEDDRVRIGRANLFVGHAPRTEIGDAKTGCTTSVELSRVDDRL